MITTDRTYGVEIEGVMPSGISRAEVTFALKQAGMDVELESYNHIVRPSWKVTTDASVGYGSGFELVSPILKGADGLRQLFTALTALTELGCSVNKSCGMHVHVYAGDFSAKEIGKISKCFLMYENFFDYIMPLSRRGSSNRYVKSNRLHSGGGYKPFHANAGMDRISAAKTIYEVYNAVQSDRFYKFNLQNLVGGHRFNTIEFRQHVGTMDTQSALNWVALLVSFVENAAKSKIRKRESFKDADKHLRAGREMADFFRMFKTPEAVQSYYKDRYAFFRDEETAVIKAEKDAIIRREEIIGNITDLIERATAKLEHMATFKRRQWNKEGRLRRNIRILQNPTAETNSKLEVAVRQLELALTPRTRRAA